MLSFSNMFQYSQQLLQRTLKWNDKDVQLQRLWIWPHLLKKSLMENFAVSKKKWIIYSDPRGERNLMADNLVDWLFQKIIASNSTQYFRNYSTFINNDS